MADPILTIATMIDSFVPEAVLRPDNAPPLDQMQIRGHQIAFDVYAAEFQDGGAPGASHTTCASKLVERSFEVAVRVAGNGAGRRKADRAAARLAPKFVAAIEHQAIPNNELHTLRLTGTWNGPTQTQGPDGSAHGWLITFPVAAEFFISTTGV